MVPVFNPSSRCIMHGGKRREEERDGRYMDAKMVPIHKRGYCQRWLPHQPFHDLARREHTYLITSLQIETERKEVYLLVLKNSAIRSYTASESWGENRPCSIPQEKSSLVLTLLPECCGGGCGFFCDPRLYLNPITAKTPRAQGKHKKAMGAMAK
jgi:hypothetical protein